MHTQGMKLPDVYAQHSALIVPITLMSLAGNGVLINGTICYLNTSSKEMTHPMKSIYHFLELALLRRLRQPAHVS